MHAFGMETYLGMVDDKSVFVNSFLKKSDKYLQITLD